MMLTIKNIRHLLMISSNVRLPVLSCLHVDMDVTLERRHYCSDKLQDSVSSSSSRQDKETKSNSKNNSKNVNRTEALRESESKTDSPQHTSIHNNAHSYDIVINGGGIVGFSLLAALYESCFMREKRILLLEQQEQTNSQHTNEALNPQGQTQRQLSNRVSALTTSSKKFFQQIGVWKEIEPFVKPIKCMHVWANSFHDGISFRPDHDNNNDENVICYITENNLITRSLHKLVSGFGHVICYGTSVTHVASNGHQVEVTTRCDRNDYTAKLDTQLIVGCDGFNSIVRKNSNLTPFEHDFDQMAIVGTVNVSNDASNAANEIAWQRFVPHNDIILALLPLTSEESSFVLSAPKHKVQHLMQMDEDTFVDEMNRALFDELPSSSSSFVSTFDRFIHSIVPPQLIPSQQKLQFSSPQVLFLEPNSRAAFPLKLSTTLPFMVGSVAGSRNNNLAIIGDAAHRVHPLAGQGLNLGIGDVQVLSKHLHDQASRGNNIFHNHQLLEQCLFNFERERQFKLIPMLAAIHSMQQLFNCVPSKALNAFNQFDSIKRQIVKFANSN